MSHHGCILHYVRAYKQKVRIFLKIENNAFCKVRGTKLLFFSMGRKSQIFKSSEVKSAFKSFF